MAKRPAADSARAVEDLKRKYEIVLSSCRLVTEAQSTLDRTLKDFCVSAEAVHPDLAAQMNEVLLPSQSPATVAESSETTAAASTKAPAKTKTDDKPVTEKKQKKERDPDMPKRPMSAFLNFQSAVRGAFKSEMSPDSANKDVLKAVADKWREMSEADREPYQKHYENDLKDYEAKMAAYNTEKGIVPKPKAKPSAPKEKPTTTTITATSPAPEPVAADDDDAAAASLVGSSDSKAAPKATKKRSRKSEAKEAEPAVEKPSTKEAEKSPEKKDKKKRKKAEGASSP